MRGNAWLRGHEFESRSPITIWMILMGHSRPLFFFVFSTGNACSVQNDSFTITTGLGAYSIEHYSSVNNESVKILAVNFHCFQVWILLTRSSFSYSIVRQWIKRGWGWSVEKKILSSYFCHWANLHCCKWPYIVKNLSIWSQSWSHLLKPESEFLRCYSKYFSICAESGRVDVIPKQISALRNNSNLKNALRLVMTSHLTYNIQSECCISE